MRLSRKYSRARELSFQQILNARIADLDLRPAGTLRDCLIQVRHELKHNHISFFPHFYFGEEPWGCIDRTGSIEIPFYLANNDLRRVAERHQVSYSENSRSAIRASTTSAAAAKTMCAISITSVTRTMPNAIRTRTLPKPLRSGWIRTPSGNGTIGHGPGRWKSCVLWIDYSGKSGSP